MKSYRKREAALQHVLEASAALPEFIQVKPRGFKAILQSLVDFLEFQQLKATMLVKLPSGATWKEDIERYCQNFDAAECYSLTRNSESGGDAAAGVISVPLENSYDWRGDYFLIALAPQFSFLVGANRIKFSPTTPLSTASNRASPGVSGDANTEGDLAGDAASQPAYLKVCFSANQDLIADVLEAVKNLVQASDVSSKLGIWSQRLRTDPGNYPIMLDRWLGWQLRMQENLRQSASMYRKQAMTASSLSSQNEILLNTLRLKDDFLNTVGQELRTPLATIKTALTLLGSPSLKAPQRQRYMDMISHECDRQSTLIRGVLDLLQMETVRDEIHPEPLRLVDTVPPVVSTYQPLAQEKGVMLAYTIPEDLPPVACPEAWLRQIAIHLLSNAIKYTESGGEVWVTALRRNDNAELEVRDNGVGIPQSELSDIFEHFYRGRNLPPGETEGAGLGLSIVQQLLMYCGGSVVVDSQVDRGTTFRVILPFYQM